MKKSIALGFAAALLVACGDDSNSSNSNATSGGCTVETNEDNTYTLSCEDGSKVVIKDGKDGTDGENCEVSRDGDELTFTCGDSSVSVNLNDYLDKSSSSVTQDKPNWVYLNPNIKYGEMTDSRDGQVYKTVVIGNQTWMAENLNYATEKSFCHDGLEENCKTHDRYYEWEDALSACPDGWHLPSKDEYDTLLATTKGNLRSNSWVNGDDVFGFSLMMVLEGEHSIGGYQYQISSIDLWTSSKNGRYVWFMRATDSEVGLDDHGGDPGPNVRCIKDSK